MARKSTTNESHHHMDMQQQPAAQPAATPSAAPTGDGGAPAEKPGRVNESKAGQTDPFSQAFNSALDDMDARAKETEQDADEPQDAPEVASPATETQVAPQTPAPAQAAPDPAPAAKELPKWWTKERRDAYRFQSRETQEAWLSEDPEPNPRWPAEIKDQFGTLPREAKEIVLNQLTEADRGLNKKFQELATERKFAEDIRAAVPAHLRSTMEQRGLTEPQVFAHLLNLQQQSMQDPAAYVRNFVQNNKLNPAELFGIEAKPNEPLQLEAIRAHPEYQQLHTKFDALNREVQQDRAQRAEEESRRLEAEFETVVQEKDGDGNPLYPYIRLLAEPMARIIESDPEQFGSMDTRSKFASAYSMALESYPELRPVKRPAPPPPADEPVVLDAHAVAEAKRAEDLQRAITPKSRTPVPPLPSNGKTGDPLDDALNAARRQLSR